MQLGVVFPQLDSGGDVAATRALVFSGATRNSLVVTDKAHVAVDGLDDVAVIATEDAVFVGRLSAAQRVGAMVKALKAAPATAAMLADWGADVVKIEPREGDWSRSITAGDLPARLKSGAEVLVGMLPGRLAGDPRWLVAGASAGASTCSARRNPARVSAACSPRLMTP